MLCIKPGQFSMFCYLILYIPNLAGFSMFFFNLILYINNFSLLSAILYCQQILNMHNVHTARSRQVLQVYGLCLIRPDIGATTPGSEVQGVSVLSFLLGRLIAVSVCRFCWVFYCSLSLLTVYAK